MSTGSDGKKSQDADRTDGIVWQTTKPKLISRNFSTGNLQTLEKRPSGLTHEGTRPDQLNHVKELQNRKGSLPSAFGNEPPIETQRPRGGSFFKDLMDKYDLKK